MKYILVITIFITIYLIHSSIKTFPGEGTCYAAYQHYDGDILVALKYKELAENDYIRIANELKKSRPKMLASQTLMLDKSSFLSKNELIKYSDFIRCHTYSSKI